MDHENIKIKVGKLAGGIQIMGKAASSWQAFISCNGSSLIIRHLKSGLAEDLEIPWPAKLKRITCEKVRFRVEDLQPLSEYMKTMDTIEMKETANSQKGRCPSWQGCSPSDICRLKTVGYQTLI
jgi:hypothetical protein